MVDASGGFDDSKVMEPVTIVLVHMFTRAELVEDPLLEQELETDVAEECRKFGPVERVKVGLLRASGQARASVNCDGWFMARLWPAVTVYSCRVS